MRRKQRNDEDDDEMVLRDTVAQRQRTVHVELSIPQIREIAEEDMGNEMENVDHMTSIWNCLDLDVQEPFNVHIDSVFAAQPNGEQSDEEQVEGADSNEEQVEGENNDQGQMSDDDEVMFVRELIDLTLD